MYPLPLPQVKQFDLLAVPALPAVAFLQVAVSRAAFLDLASAVEQEGRQEGLQLLARLTKMVSGIPNNCVMALNVLSMHDLRLGGG